MNLSEFEIRIGEYCFRHRNWLFPVIAAVLFATAAPPTRIAGSELLEHLKDLLAVMICSTGLSIRAAVIGFAYIKRGGVNKQVFADQLQTAGLFQLCRNPIYCGNMLIWPAIFLLHGNLWVFLIGTGSFYWIYRCIIRTEENYLQGKFGEEYVQYCRDTPRWWPRLERRQAATQDLQFDWRRVLLNDYGTVATAIVAIALTEIYEYHAAGAEQAEYRWQLWLLIFATLLATGLVKWIKRKGLLVPHSGN